jgi:hypothetical protein
VRLAFFFVGPPDRVHRETHRLQADTPSPDGNPRVDTIHQAGIWLGFRVRLQPLKVHDARIVASARLQLDIARLALPSENSSDRRSSNTEQLCGRAVRPGEASLVRCDDSPTEIDGDHHPHV